MKYLDPSYVTKMDCQLMDLSEDITGLVLGYLNQFDLLNYGYTCKRSSRLVNELLYSRIYITGKSNRIKTAIKETKDGDAYYSWTVVRNSLRDPECGLKLLERTLSERRDLATKVKDIITDDVTFILFKLKFWYRRYFQSNNSISRVLFGDVPLNQMNVVYEDIFDFYKLSGLNLRSVQLKSVSDLILLLSHHDLSRLSSINFSFVDTSDYNFATGLMNEKVRQKLKTIFNNLESLHILSTHNLGLRFFSIIREIFSTGKILNNLNELTLNHCHGRNCSHVNFNSIYNFDQEMALDFAIIEDTCNISKIKRLSFEVDCNYIYKVQSPEDFEFGIAENDDFCDCLERFFDRFAASTDAFKKLRCLKITRNNKSIIENPYGIFYFKHCLDRMLHADLKLNSLTIDTNAELFPFFHFKGDVRFARLFKLFISQNKQLLKKLEQIDVVELRIEDYIESFYVWHVAIPELHERNVCNCDQCEAAKQGMVSFAKTNEEIQFYLNPTTIKSIQEFLFDLVSVLLKYRKNYKLTKSSNTSPNALTVASKTDRLDNPVIYISPHDRLMQVHNRDSLDLHSHFRHSDYKELVNFKYVKSLASANNCDMKISCSCKTSQVHDFNAFLVHQLRAHLTHEHLFISSDVSCRLNDLVHTH